MKVTVSLITHNYSACSVRTSVHTGEWWKLLNWQTEPLKEKVHWGVECAWKNITILYYQLQCRNVNTGTSGTFMALKTSSVWRFESNFWKPAVSISTTRNSFWKLSWKKVMQLWKRKDVIITTYLFSCWQNNKNVSINISMCDRWSYNPKNIHCDLDFQNTTSHVASNQ